MNTSTRRKLAAAVIPFALFVAACGSSGGSDSSSSKTTETTMAKGTDSSTTAANSGASTMAAPEGDGCAAVPKTGSGSFDGMAQDPVATAASNNPALSTLVTAVTKAGLGDTLNTGGPFTIFAPTNDAFAKIPAADLDKVLADKATLTSILTYHVIPERIEPADLGGTYTTVNGAKLTVSGDAPAFEVGADGAKVVCSGVQTANATVYLVDSVLMPPAAG
ncbi:fasciclin domain-containing protein [Aquihabitans sp. McL0605]|uniref:fasciclin domain-containing protein n=1 Tax=Aquihabitans sp. McL0605 TaxID=3415671 RepID=UPI003CEF3EB9